MIDLEDVRAALHERPGHPLPELDIAQIMVTGRKIRRQRRLRQTGALLAGATLSTVLVASLGPAFLSNASGREHRPQPGSAQSRATSTSLPDAVGATVGLASITLVSYTGTQPRGYKVSWIPQNWVIQGGNPTALTIASRDARDKDPNHFVNKLVVLSASDHETRPGTSQPVDGRPGTLSIEGDTQSLEYTSSTGRWVLIQAPTSLGWSGSQIAKFAAGVEVLAEARTGLG